MSVARRHCENCQKRAIFLSRQIRHSAGCQSDFESAKERQLEVSHVRGIRSGTFAAQRVPECKVYEFT